MKKNQGSKKDVAQRLCLSCGKMFSSQHKFNRRCFTCENNMKNNEAIGYMRPFLRCAPSGKLYEGQMYSEGEKRNLEEFVEVKK